MAKYSWRDLPFDAEVNAQLFDHFCKRSSEKDPVKPGKPDLYKILLKYILASGNLTIVRFEEGIPILRTGNATHVTGDVTADVTPAPAQEMDLTFGSQSQSQSQSPQPCHGQTPTQLAQAEVKLAKVALDKATRTAQERSQEEARRSRGRSRRPLRTPNRRKMRGTRLQWTSWTGSLHVRSCAGKRNAPGFPAGRRSRASHTPTSTAWSSARTRHTCQWPPGPGA
jgi:hypothetical protein